jgi:hypothetical protein
MGNPYFNNRYSKQNNEYELYRAACDELVEIHGIDFKYVTKEHVSQDFIFGEDKNMKFNGFKYVTMLIENYENFDGADDMFSKFGFQIDNKLTLLVEQKRFIEKIGKEPEIDDLIFHEPTGKIFQVKHCVDDFGFHQMNSDKYMFNLTCDIYIPSHEDFNTNDATIDSLNDLADSNTTQEADQFDTEKVNTLDFSEHDIFNNL